MANPFRSLLERASRGFTMKQKIGLTVLAGIYIVSPIDALPDVIPLLGWVDDAFVINLLRKVWMSPTLPPKGGSGSGGALKAQVAAAFTRAWKNFAEGFAEGQKGRS